MTDEQIEQLAQRVAKLYLINCMKVYYLICNLMQKKNY